MQKITAKVDRQATSLLDFTFWSNIVVLAFITGVNIVNFNRASTEQGALLAAASPNLVLIVSLALILYMGYGCYGALSTKNRLHRVVLAMDDAGVSGVSLPNPTKNEQGEAFSISFDQIYSVSIVDIAITKKHTAPSLKIESVECAYFVPAPEGLKEIVRLIAERMPAK